MRLCFTCFTIENWLLTQQCCVKNSTTYRVYDTKIALYCFFFLFVIYRTVSLKILKTDVFVKNTCVFAPQKCQVKLKLVSFELEKKRNFFREILRSQPVITQTKPAKTK